MLRYARSFPVMEKWTKYYKSFYSYWTRDLVFKDWLIENEECKKAHCKTCKIDLRAHKADLLKHTCTSKHKAAMKALASKEISHILMFFTPINNHIAKLDIGLAIYIACHFSINSIDYFTDILKNEIVSSSKKTPLHLHRTKCLELIKKI